MIIVDKSVTVATNNEPTNFNIDYRQLPSNFVKADSPIFGIGIVKRDVYDSVYVNYVYTSLECQKNTRVFSMVFESPSGVEYSTPYICKYGGVYDYVGKRFTQPNAWSVSKVGININGEFCKNVRINSKKVSEFDPASTALINMSYNCFINGMLVC